ncbi:MAG TPA: hypothetical protein VK928_00865 [Longimicrobiales bacterium]|nr:hypothetical protein [Longimicrobiales bacterium]
MQLRSLFLSATLTFAVASAAHAGPPWISVEMPANPHHPSTRDATLLVRAYHHSTGLNAPLRGSAEGIVDGRRVSLPLDLRPTNQAGVFALATPLPKGGTWVLAITLRESGESSATALVTVDTHGRVVAVDVPSGRSRDGWTVPRAVDAGDIEAALRAAHVAHGGTPADSPAGRLAYALPLLLIGGVAVAGAARMRK